MKLILVLSLLTGGASAFQQSTRSISFSSYYAPAVRQPSALAVAAGVGTVVKIDGNAPRDVESMDEWSTACGVQKAEGVQLYTEDGTDWSVATNQDLAAGSPVVFVPQTMILSSENVRQEFGASLAAAEQRMVDANVADLIPQFALFVKILAEYELGDQSPYFPWLNSLPKRYNNGASMTWGCFELLPPYVAWLSMKERVNLSNFRKALKLVGLGKQTVRNKKLTEWAYNVVVTRSFDAADGEKRIVPVADMFNHGTETEVDMNYDEEGNCMVYATQDVPAGSPLRMSYGDPTNPSPFLATYGFLDETSPASFCKLMNLQQEMQDMGVDFSKMLFYKDTGDISEEVWDVLLYQILASDPNLQQGFFQACMSGDMETKNSYHQEYFSYTYGALNDHVEGFLRQLDELSEKAYSRDVKKYPRVPLILQHNEFVKNTFLNVKANLDAMV